MFETVPIETDPYASCRNAIRYWEMGEEWDAQRAAERVQDVIRGGLDYYLSRAYTATAAAVAYFDRHGISPFSDDPFHGNPVLEKQAIEAARAALPEIKTAAFANFVRSRVGAM
jgi:hypothetical protein